MNHVSKSLRLRIGIFGKTNAGKSSFLNLITGQDVSIVSNVAGTTTDSVEKNMELLPIGPVTFVDTAGIDDNTALGEQRKERTARSLTTCDVALLVTSGYSWTLWEETFFNQCKNQNIPVIVICNKIDLQTDDTQAEKAWAQKNAPLPDMKISCTKALKDNNLREEYILKFKGVLISKCPESFFVVQPILQDLLNSKKTSENKIPLVMLVIPIDIQAPKGRLIMPQVQSIRDALDGNAAVIMVKAESFGYMLNNLKSAPDLVVCDSQVAKQVASDCPTEIPCTTFSILFSRFKGDIIELAKGAAIIETLQDGDSVLIAESCTHHAMEDDIGKVKIPNLLQKKAGEKNIVIEHCSGIDFPSNLQKYKLVIHCGACMLNRRAMLWRIEQARAANVAITNYGMAISAMQGVAERMLSPLSEALCVYKKYL